MYSTETPFEKVFLDRIKPGRKHNPETWLNTEMKGTNELIKAFICDNADRGHTFNLIIIGNTLYVDEGNDGKNVFYYQLAIRLPGGVYIVNMRAKYDKQIQYIYKVLQHNQTWIKYIMLPTLNHKKDYGVIDPDQLRKAISDEANNSVVKRALIRYGREQKQATAFEELNQLHIILEQLQYPDRRGPYNKTVITVALEQLQHTKKVCATLDKYLDVLKQFPEPEP